MNSAHQADTRHSACRLLQQHALPLRASAICVLRFAFRHLPFAFVWLYAAAIVAWYLARLAWGDRLWVLAVLNSFPAWLFLPAPLMPVLAALTRRRVAWVAAIVPVALWVAAIVPVALWVAAIVPVALWLALFGWRFLPRAPRA